MIKVRFTRKAIVSLNQEFITEYEKDGVCYRNDLSVPFYLMKDALVELKSIVEKHLGEEVELVPSDFEQKIQDYGSNPKNWPSQPECNCCCHCKGGLGSIGMSCCD